MNKNKIRLIKRNQERKTNIYMVSYVSTPLYMRENAFILNVSDIICTTVIKVVKLTNTTQFPRFCLANLQII